MVNLNPKVEGELVSKALRINKLNKQTLKAYLEGNFSKASECIGEFIDLKSEIEVRLLDLPVAKDLTA